MTSYIIDAVRTPRGKRKGSLSNLHPVDLASIPLTAISKRNELNKERIDDVIFGCVSERDEQDNVITKKALMASGFPESVPGVVLNRFCGSGLSACNWAAQSVMSGMQDLVIAGGVEHMTRVPMEIDFYNGESQLNKAYPKLVMQGESAEMIAERYSYDRNKVDAYAERSQNLAAKAWEQGAFQKSIVPIAFNNTQGESITLEKDEHMRPGTTVETLSALKPVFRQNGVITAGNSSGIVDGSAAVLFASEQGVKQNNLKPRARVLSTAIVSSDPVIMLLGPIPAIQKALGKAQLKLEQIDLFEINEAFAPVPLAVSEELNIPMEKINVNGGAIAMGHPLGATGAMLLGTALDELENRNQQYACVSLCIGMGMGVAMIIERIK
ncbi:MAG: acetyl-CoA C-acyltransferase [Deltaproteobacteria bacterium]|nr:acetyl-CoA C-acyltransferase [Deltaproteobacteria bacterium]